MEELKVGSNIICKKDMGGVIHVGDICEIIDIDNSIITFRFDNYHKGVMSLDEYNTYFNLYVNDDEFANTVLENLYIVKNVTYSFRTNGRHTYVKAEYNGKTYVGKSSCNPCDTYNFNYGFTLALSRCYSKLIMDLLAVN